MTEELPYLSGYEPHLIDSARRLLEENRLGEVILKKYPHAHGVRSDKALYDYVISLKNAFLKQSSPLSRIVYDDRISVLQQALGQHRFVTRVQGGRLKAKNEIRIASVFKKMPAEFLQMIAVHELAHLREKDHNRAFYKLCTHMAPDYFQLEFDTRLYLTHLDQNGPLYR